MTEQVAEGVVFRVTEKAWSDFVFYTVKLDGVDGWYRMGKERYANIIEPGNTVKFGWKQDDNGNLVVVPGHVSLIAAGNGAPPPPSKPKATPKATGGGGSNQMSKQDWAEKDLSIQYQSARKDALQYLSLVIDQESFKLPAKTKPVERLAALDGLLDLYTAKFFTDIAGRSALARNEDEHEVVAAIEAPSGDTPQEQVDAQWDGAAADAGEWG